MDNIEKVELEWQKIWLQILTGPFLPQGVNETVHDSAESMKILLRSMNCAWYDECESPSEEEKLIWAREAESLITWRFWKSLRQEYRAMIPKVEPDSFEEAFFMAKAVENQLSYVNFRAAINSQRYPIIFRKEFTFEISKKRNEMTGKGRERNYKIRIEKLSIYRIHGYIRPEFSEIKRKKSIKGAKFIVELTQLQRQLKIGWLNISEGGGNFSHVEENQICDDETFKISETHDQQSSVADDTPNKKCTKLGVSEPGTGKGPKQTISCAINHSIRKSKHGEEVHEARHVIIAQDEILENRRL
ncbi:hypothetical protein QAD02_013723 [Eretmocerus hayati]|uniref:Uncharacterized protein n=1 Tax=Eretmocerus hayati TaxID=131215 RepID=A0ACC2P526_9HYME|nr:hypothetical protein QAD02_013723 [Eretmocerus hayati]